MNIKKLSCFTKVTFAILTVLILLPLHFLYGQGHDHSGHDHAGHDHQNDHLQATTANSSASTIKWYSVEEAYRLNKLNPKPFFFDVYTDWCGWCKRMDATTFQDANVVAYLNTYFYPIKFNAEGKDTVFFLERKFYNSQDTYVKQMFAEIDSVIKLSNDSLKLIGQAKNERDSISVFRLAQQIREKNNQRSQLARQASKTTHDLARDLMNNQLSYPTFVILFDSLRQNFPLKGFQQPTQLLSVLSFFAEEIYKNTNDLQSFQMQYNEVFGGKIYQTPAYYTNFSKALSQGAAANKKTLVLITNDQLYTSHMMEKGSFINPEIEKVLQEGFNVVKLNLFEKDSMIFKETTYRNEGGVHQLAMGFLQEERKLPVMIILDAQHNFISRVPGYFLPNDLKPVLLFFKDEIYKTKDWHTYRKEYFEKK